MRSTVPFVIFCILACYCVDNNAYYISKKSISTTTSTTTDNNHRISLQQNRKVFTLFYRFPFQEDANSDSKATTTTSKTATKTNKPTPAPSLQQQQSKTKTNSFLAEKAVKVKELAIREEEISEFKSDVIKSLSFTAAALGFAAGLSLWKGPSAAIEFSSGYILELCLSVDNLFVFLLLFDYFKVDKKNQERVLRWGIIGAIVLRGLFVGAGAVALEKFHQILLFFAAILGYSSYKIVFAKEDDEEEDLSENKLVQLSKKFFPSTDHFDGNKFFTYENGVKLATPLFICLICIELSDIVFALDSVPAIFGVTEDPFIVYTSNIFAIAGLRALYGTLSNAVKDLVYLEKAVGLVLGVIAIKMSSEVFGYTLLDPIKSLVLVLSILGCGVVLSLEAQKNAREKLT